MKTEANDFKFLLEQFDAARQPARQPLREHPLPGPGSSVAGGVCPVQTPIAAGILGRCRHRVRHLRPGPDPAPGRAQHRHPPALRPAPAPALHRDRPHSGALRSAGDAGPGRAGRWRPLPADVDPPLALAPTVDSGSRPVRVRPTALPHQPA